MIIKDIFEVDAPADRVWPITETVDDMTYKGKVSVKIGSGGVVATLGGRLIEGGAKKTVAEFSANLAKLL